MNHRSPAQYAVLPVHEVVAIVREWVELYARYLPDFAGAYLWGGLTALPADAPFALYRDVDVVVVLTKGAQDHEQEVFYRGIMLEIISKNLEEHQVAEIVLADPSAGPNLATTYILADPIGILLPLHQAVAAQYRQRRWIQERCAAEQAAAEQQLAAMRQVTNPVGNQEPLWAVWGLLNALSGLLAVAQLKRPTTRRTLSLLGELLDEQGRSDLREAALAVWGSANMTQADVQAMLDRSVVVFDHSVAVYRTPTPFGFTIRAHLRPYLVEATQEMIDEGNYREATFWIITLVTEAYLVLENDASDAEKPVFAAQLHALLAALGYASTTAWAERVDTAERLAVDVYRIAAALVAQQPE